MVASGKRELCLEIKQDLNLNNRYPWRAPLTACQHCFACSRVFLTVQKCGDDDKKIEGHGLVNVVTSTKNDWWEEFLRSFYKTDTWPFPLHVKGVFFMEPSHTVLLILFRVPKWIWLGMHMCVQSLQNGKYIEARICRCCTECANIAVSI